MLGVSGGCGGGAGWWRGVVVPWLLPLPLPPAAAVAVVAVDPLEEPLELPRVKEESMV